MRSLGYPDDARNNSPLFVVDCSPRFRQEHIYLFCEIFRISHESKLFADLGNHLIAFSISLIRKIRLKNNERFEPLQLCNVHQ